MSVKSALQVIGALAETPHRAVAYDWSGGEPDDRLLHLARESDAVFLALHGGGGEGGELQAALEHAGIFHYTGSDAEGAALALDKAKAKACVAEAGIPVAQSAVWHPGEAPPNVTLPAIAKPLWGGSSVGLVSIKTPKELAAYRPSEPLLVEEYLPLREFTIGILDGKALPAVEIVPLGGVYDYEHKYTPGATRELCPAPIDREKAERLTALALGAFEVLGLRDFARIDFKENAEGVPCFLEANTLPGLTETSLLPLAAGAVGIPFTALCERMAKAAAKRKRKP